MLPVVCVRLTTKLTIAAQLFQGLPPLQQRARLGEPQPTKARVQRAWITVPEVAEEIRLHMAFREELLIAAETGFAGRKEFLVDLGVSKPDIGPQSRPSARAAMIM